MAEFDSSDVKVEFDNAGGTLVDVTEYVLDFPGIMVQRGVDDAWSPLGAVLERKGITAIDIVDDPELTLKCDDAATTGPVALFVRGAVDRELQVTYGGAIVRLITTGVVSSDPVIENGKMTRLKVRLVNTGAAITG